MDEITKKAIPKAISDLDRAICAFQAAARLREDSAEFRQVCHEARKLIQTVEKTAAKLARKRQTDCQFAGCWEPAERWFVASLGPDTVKRVGLCAVHAATTGLKETLRPRLVTE